MKSILLFSYCLCVYGASWTEKEWKENKTKRETEKPKKGMVWERLSVGRRRRPWLALLFLCLAATALLEPRADLLESGLMRNINQYKKAVLFDQFLKDRLSPEEQWDWHQWDEGLISGYEHYFTEEEASVMQLLRDYIQQNKVDTILQEYRTSSRDDHYDQRRYVRGVYSCPYQAGNRLNQFLNAFAFAIVTNRTLLWHYCDDDEICPMHYNVQDCEKVLRRASWIPSMDATTATTSYPWSSTPPITQLWNNSHPTRSEVLHPRAVPLDAMTDPIIDIGVMEACTSPILASPAALQIISPSAHQVALRLFSAGRRFAFGALFQAAFRLHPELLPPPGLVEEQMMAREEPQGISMAIHARHLFPEDDGSDTTVDEMCLEQAYQTVKNRTSAVPDNNNNNSSSSQLCSIIVMADRSVTLQRLSSKVHRMGCDKAVAAHQRGNSWSNEHGAFAGAGFFQDLALAQYASDAVVLTKKSTATGLLAALVAFRRTQVNHNMTTLRPLVMCFTNRADRRCDCVDPRGRGIRRRWRR